MKRVHDVCVIGAGPAGSAAAIIAAKAGLDVVVLDRSALPRDKACGDGLTTPALRELARLGVPVTSLRSWTPITSARVYPPEGPPVSLDLPSDGGPYAGTARRYELDAELAASARRAGADLRAPLEVIGFRQTRDVCTVDTAGGLLRARAVIVATGARGRSPARSDLHATRAYVDADGVGTGVAHVWFLPDILPGYAWLFPGPGPFNFGTAVHRSEHSARTAVRQSQRLLTGPVLAAAGIRVTGHDRIRSWRIPVPPVRGSEGRVLYVGDAAGVADPMTGEGIGQALLTGRLAAEAIINLGPRHADPAAAYRRQTSRALAASHLVAAAGAWALRSPRRASAAVRLMGGSSRRRQFFARWMWEEVPRHAVLSPRQYVRRPRGASCG